MLMRNNEELTPESTAGISNLSQHSSDAFENLNLVIPHLFNAIKAMDLAIRPFSDAVEKLSSLTPSVSNELKELSQELKSKFEYFTKQNKRLQELRFKPLTDCGLWLAPSMLPRMISDVVEKYEQGKARTIPMMIEGYYRINGFQNLKEAVSGWKSIKYYSQRMQIFEDALEAHINGKWTLSIPSLLPHIEGISREILKANNWTIVGSKVMVEHGHSTFPSKVFQNLHIEDFSLDYFLLGILVYYLESTLYSYVNLNGSRVGKMRKMNRHGILHGVQLKYATRLNSLRCFLALDSLSVFVDG